MVHKKVQDCQVPRRLSLGGYLKAAAAAGIASQMPILDVLATPSPKRRFDGELIEESYNIAHRMRDEKLSIPSLTPKGPLDAAARGCAQILRDKTASARRPASIHA
ncbi:MAG: hypothetical protein V3U86_12195 [Acidobacteriota bacterium]